MKVRAIIVVVLALLVAALIVRVAFVDAYASRQPAKAAAIWPGHPEVVFATGLQEVGQLAATGRTVDNAIIDRLISVAIKAPLAPEPFLVRGVQAQLAGNQPLAAGAFLEARRRDPHSIAARYFLADHFLRTRQIGQGLAEISALARLVPQSLDGIAPHLAAFARSPGSAAEVKAMLLKHPELEPLLLNELAANPGNDQLVLYLWSGRGGDNARAWQERLLNSLVEAGRYSQAFTTWSRFSSNSDQRQDLAGPAFESGALSPFGWSLASGTAGFAEATGSGRLHVIYYGRDDLVIAKRLLMLGPGAYRLSMRISGGSPGAKSLSWTVRCLPSSDEIANAGVANANNGELAATFIIPPAGCVAQQLQLVGTALDLPQKDEFTLADLRIARVPGR